MKKRKRIIALLITFGLCFTIVPAESNDISSAATATPVERHGNLMVKGADLLDQNGEVYQLRGISTHGIAWYPQYVNKAAFKELRDKWGMDMVRLAMYTEEYNGYTNSGTENRKKQRKIIYKGIDAATDLGMYVIVDWHILNDGNPNKHLSSAKNFFQLVSKKYRNQNNVIYEICNEPNGKTSWTQIKAYAKKVIPIIRRNDPDAVIIVGTPTWSQDVDKAASSPLKGYENLLYSLHFYAGTHKQALRDRLSSARKKGLPIFVSEFGISDASGSGTLNKTQGNKWISLLDQYQISYAAWNFSNKKEATALLKSSCKKTAGFTRNDLSAYGRWFVDKLK